MSFIKKIWEAIKGFFIMLSRYLRRIGKASKFKIEYLDTLEYSGTNNIITWSDVPIGTPDDTRRIFVVTNTSVSVFAAYVDDVEINYSTDTGTVDGRKTMVFKTGNYLTSGTTADIKVNRGTNDDNVIVMVYSLKGGAIPGTHGYSSVTGDPTSSREITIDGDEILVCYSHTAANNEVTPEWGNVKELATYLGSTESVSIGYSEKQGTYDVSVTWDSNNGMAANKFSTENY